MAGVAVAVKKWQCRLSLAFFIILVVACVTAENKPPTVLAQSKENMAGITIITENGGHLSWSKKNNKIAFDRLGKDKYFDLWIMSPDGGNQDGPLEIYEMNVDSGVVKRLTHHSAYIWDEHAQYSPDGKKIIWMSSKGLRFSVKPFDLETEFWIMNRDSSSKRQLTRFHTPNHPHYLNRPFVVAADFDWSPDGSQIAALVLTNRPETRDRGSGMNVLIDLPKK